MKFSFHPAAAEELESAVVYYELNQRGHGLDFAEEVAAAITRILQHPNAWMPLSKNSRRCIISRFPYGIIYQVKTRTLRIIAIAHLSRKPEYWKNRL